MRIIVLRKVRRRSVARFAKRWQELQKLCADPSSWAEAVLAADKLLGDVLKKRRFKGKRIGERLVAAQKQLSNKDAVWFGHNLSKKIIEEGAGIKLKQEEVKSALIGIRQALKDLGAFGYEQNKDSK